MVKLVQLIKNDQEKESEEVILEEKGTSQIMIQFFFFSSMQWDGGQRKK